MRRLIRLFGIPIDALNMKETLSLIDTTIQEKKHLHHTVVNAGKIVLMKRDKQLYQSVVNADLINADGMAVVWASRWLNRPLPERVNGTNLMEALVKMAFEKRYKIFFLGAREEIVKAVVDKYSKQYNSDIIAGWRNGYFDPSQQKEIAQSIAKSGAHILFVAISSPVKENFLYQNKNILQSVNFTMGVGGSFDVVSGKVKRAPVWMQNAGLEWFFRLIQEPKRMWKRYTIGNLRFIAMVLKAKYDKH